MALYLIEKQYGQLLSKELTWIDPSEADVLFFSPHKDQAVNQLVELSAKDTSVRGKVTPCAVDDRGRPLLTQFTATAD